MERNQQESQSQFERDLGEKHGQLLLEKANLQQDMSSLKASIKNLEQDNEGLNTELEEARQKLELS